MTATPSINTIPLRSFNCTLLQKSLGKKGVMYNFMNKQSKKRGKKLCITVSGCLLIAIFFNVCMPFVVVYVLIKVTVLMVHCFPTSLKMKPMPELQREVYLLD